MLRTFLFVHLGNFKDFVLLFVFANIAHEFANSVLCFFKYTLWANFRNLVYKVQERKVHYACTHVAKHALNNTVQKKHRHVVLLWLPWWIIVIFQSLHSRMKKPCIWINHFVNLLIIDLIFSTSLPIVLVLFIILFSADCAQKYMYMYM